MAAQQIESQNAANVQISLTSDQSLKLQSTIKVGLYKELHKKGLLTDAQLKQLISLQNT